MGHIWAEQHQVAIVIARHIVADIAMPAAVEGQGQFVFGGGAMIVSFESSEEAGSWPQERFLAAIKNPTSEVVSR
ncbi:hypothetical protein ASE33_25755 [Pseudomonas sp. Root9]|nr:hypothetical protein ASE33_25755 [Pseudomonas sp. Root9]